MLTDMHPKLPMRNITLTKEFYLNKIGFTIKGDYGDYLIVGKDKIEIHFFKYAELGTKLNYGQVYIRTNNIAEFYQSLLDTKTAIHLNGHLDIKPWGQKEFALLDPDKNLLTIGQEM